MLPLIEGEYLQLEKKAMAEDKDKNGEIIFFDKSIILDLTLKHIKIPLYHPSFFFARK